MEKQLQLQQGVNEFLREFKLKLEIYSVIFRDDRKKNTEALLSLDMLPIQRKEFLKKLEVTDYFDGPVDDKLNSSHPLWMFGKSYKGKDIYIKIATGFENSPVICISFHTAEYAISYPFKN